MVTGKRPARKRNTRATLLAPMALLLAGFVCTEPMQAQLPGLPLPVLVPTTYVFRVPIKKVVPNPCTTGFELITGTLDFTIATTNSVTTGFGAVVDIASAGIGQDALATGVLILNGTQKPHYTYAYSTGFDAKFPAIPLDFAATTAVTDYLVRGPAYPNESFMLNTLFELVFTNGVPSVPVIRELTVACARQPAP